MVANKWVVILAMAGIAGCGVINKYSDSSNDYANLRDGFQTPPDSIRPAVYWYWLNDNISPEGVVKDLQSMKEVGIGTAFIGNIGLTPEEGTSYGDVKLFSDTWWKATEAALSYASEQNIAIGMFNSPGWSQSGGPWVKPEESMRYLTGEELLLTGPAVVNIPLKKMPENFRDVALLAYPASQKRLALADWKPAVTASKTVPGLNALVDGNTDTFAEFAQAKEQPFYIDIALNKACSARSVLLYPAKKAFSVQVELQAWNGSKFETIKSIAFDRSNRNLHVGFVPDAPLAIALPLTVSDRFRFNFKQASAPVALAEINISSVPVVESYMEKQLAKMYPAPLALWNEYQWPAADADVPQELTVASKSVKNISANLSKEGVLSWTVPPGDWVVTRYGMLPTGVTNAPASKEGIGLEVDKINKDVLNAHFDAFIGKVLTRIPVDQRSTFKYVVADSYEVGSQNWTDGMAERFKKRFQYDPLPFLPVLNGTIINSADESDRFLWDLRRLVADLVAEEYVGGLKKLSNQHGLKLWLENYGHWGFPSEFLKYGGESDEVSGEFWNEGELGNIENRAASSSAHIYGKQRVWSESFTAGGGTYARYPAMLKRRGDWAFTEGVNQTLFHLFIHQPYEDKFPGMNAWFSTEFNRKNTWFSYSKSYIDYIRRCNLMLQQGNPVNDIAYFIGEDAPKMTGTRDPEIPEGYSYDYINADVILRHLSVKDGRFVLPHGMSYAMIVLPKLETMTPEVLAKLKELTAQGGTIMGPPPSRSPSLTGYPESDRMIKAMATELWGGKALQKGIAAYGKGHVINGATLQEALDYLKIDPDFSSNVGKDMLYAHRSLKDTEIYFITNQSDKPIATDVTFRVNGKQPEWWNAVTGESRVLPEFKSQDQVTKVPVVLGVNESAFVVFNKTDNPSTDVKPGSNFPVYTDLQVLSKPWNVQFQGMLNEPAINIVMNTLQPWNKMKDKSINTYSGMALYKTTFNMDGANDKDSLYLNLGDVSVMAQVKVNGKLAGTLWTAPWRISVGQLVKSGENTLEIEVINTWANKLIGEAALPVKDKKTWTNYNLYKSDDALMQSGLLGPVSLQSGK